jgi:hypothetical protein
MTLLIKGGKMSKFNAIIGAMQAKSQLNEMDREQLIDLYVKYSPLLECTDFVSYDEVMERLKTDQLDKLRNEVGFFLMTYGY